MEFYEKAVQELELTIADAKVQIDRADKALQLAENPVFKELVLEGYFVQEAARLAHLVHSPNLNEQGREMCRMDLAGPAAFKRYMQTIVQMGQEARRAMGEAQEMMSQIETDPEGFAEEFGGE